MQIQTIIYSPNTQFRLRSFMLKHASRARGHVNLSTTWALVDKLFFQCNQARFFLQSLSPPILLLVSSTLNRENQMLQSNFVHFTYFKISLCTGNGQNKLNIQLDVLCLSSHLLLPYISGVLSAHPMIVQHRSIPTTVGIQTGIATFCCCLYIYK